MKKNNNVLFVRSSFEVNGPGLLCLSYAKELRRQGYEVVFCGAEGSLDNEIEDNKFKKYTISGMAVSGNRIISLLSNAKEIRRIIAKEAISIVMGHNSIATFTAMLANVLKKKVQFFNMVHGKGKENFLKLLPCKLFAVSEDSKKYLESFGIKSERIEILHPSTIDLNVFDPNKYDAKKVRHEFGIADDSVLVGSIAMFNDNDATVTKGQKHIVECIPKIINKNPKIHFIFVGDGPMRYTLQEQVKEQGIEKHVVFTGVRRDIPNILAGIDMFCHFPDQETFGMVITEAMSMGKPVVARAVGGIKEIVSDGSSGYLVVDKEDLIEKVLLLASDENMRTSFGNAGIDIIKEKYSLDSIVRNLISYFN